MNARKFQMRFSARYIDPDNSVDQLEVECLNNGEWQRLDLDIRSPGFQLFNYGLFSCQHLYFRLNAAERGLMLTSSKAHLTIETDTDWNIQLLHVDFTGFLKCGSPTLEAITYITERMGACPVSSNVKAVANTKRTVTFETG